VNPHAEYTTRLEQRREAASRLRQSHRRTGNLRLLTALAAVAVGWFAFGQLTISPAWIIVPAGLFAGLVVFHARILREYDLASRAAGYYEHGLARLEDRWSGMGESGERFCDPHHVYSDDLDLFGKGSLFQLLSTARTRAGEDTLAGWLLEHPDAGEVRARQQGVAELRPSLDLRERLAVHGETVRSGIHPAAVTAWGEQPEVRFPPGSRIFAPLVAASALITFCLYMAGVTNRTPFLIALAVVFAVWFVLRAPTVQVMNAVEAPARDLALLAELLRILEDQRFEAPLLADLHGRLSASGLVASKRIARLRRLVSLLDWQRHMVFAPVAIVLLWGPQLALAIESWRRHAGKAIGTWIATVGEFEALLALAGYAFEHPRDPFPEFTDAPASFEADGLGHPLMPEAKSIRNSLRIGGELRLLVVSGSNMSGKSTLLRSIGLNSVLAWAGAPVRARKLALSKVRIGASIRIVDSLQEGKSRFYAEITRLRQILDLTAGTAPVLFLIDEMLSGTNSHDRRIGAEAIVRGLLDRGAFGLITTHDLALADIPGKLAHPAVNVHFEDSIADGSIHFDYLLRPGVVEHSNALELMRSVGLEV
jgi:hypothetical protein